MMPRMTARTASDIMIRPFNQKKPVSSRSFASQPQRQKRTKRRV
jgi:hypothetical protein